MDFMFDWETEGDRFSFEDSDRFEEDSLCSWISEPESLCNNWRGWRKQNGGQPIQPLYCKKEGECSCAYGPKCLQEYRTVNDEFLVADGQFGGNLRNLLYSKVQ